MLRPLKILDKKIEEGEELYLIQRRGEHELNPKWLSKSSIQEKYSQY